VVPARRQQRDLERRNEELERLNRELDDASKAMRALYADLQDKAESLAGLSEMKSRLVAGVSHEFRTPLNAISGLADLLKSRLDGDLTPEQERQVALIKESATALTAMVDDLLDLSKADAGKQHLRPSLFTVGTLFAALLGLFRAIHDGQQVELTFDASHADLELQTDEGKVAQILRNLVSNALKFTERGSVTVAAAPSGESRVSFTVRDTGIGIARGDLPRVFEEFAQVQGPVQDRVRGTGLGLPLSRALAGVLGGTLTLESEPGHGSLFTLDIPRLAPVPGQGREARLAT
jgi:signal transduction histidine kinase